MKLYITTNNEKLESIFEDQISTIEEISRDEFLDSLPLTELVHTALEKHFGEDLLGVKFDIISDFQQWTSLQTNPSAAKRRAKTPLFITDDFDQDAAFAIMADVRNQVAALAQESAV